MPDKPTYLGLLNAIAVAEGRGRELLDGWARVTGDDQLRSALRLVAIREWEHAAAFTKRISELGFDVRVEPSADFDERLRCATSDIDDCSKFEQVLGYGSEREDSFGELFQDKSIDPTTGALLGRFIAEERDSGRRLQCEYQRLREHPGASSAENQTLEQLDARLERLTATLDELKRLYSDKISGTGRS